MTTGDAAGEPTTGRDAIGMQLDRLRARLAINARRPASLAANRDDSAAVVLERDPCRVRHSGTPYESCSQIEPAVPMSTSTVDA